MRFALRGNGTGAFVVSFVLALRLSACALAGDTEATDQLSLTDLVKYRVALAGKPTADDAKVSDPPVEVGFKDVWHRPEVFLGRRIIVEGRIERIFRQGPVGDFAALAEIWITSAASDPFCLVVPQENSNAKAPSQNHSTGASTMHEQLPKLGQMVRFTGTFLKMVRYAAGDGDRLAPLVVGNQPPVRLPDVSKANNMNSFAKNDAGSNWTTWPGIGLLTLALALLAAVTIVIRHSRLTSLRIERRAQQRRARASLGVDPPLEFVDENYKR